MFIVKYSIISERLKYDSAKYLPFLLVLSLNKGMFYIYKKLC